MSMNFTTIKNTELETVIHFEAPSNESATITLADLTSYSQVRNTDTPKVNIVRFQCTGELGSGLKVTRSIKTIIATAPENCFTMDLAGNGVSDNVANNENITISSTVANKAVSGYITLRKIQGWSTKVEPGRFGSYDDPTRAGA